jgi:hypothetical protein
MAVPPLAVLSGWLVTWLTYPGTWKWDRSVKWVSVNRAMSLRRSRSRISSSFLWGFSPLAFHKRSRRDSPVDAIRASGKGVG